MTMTSGGVPICDAACISLRASLPVDTMTAAAWLSLRMCRWSDTVLVV